MRVIGLHDWITTFWTGRTFTEQVGFGITLARVINSGLSKTVEFVP